MSHAGRPAVEITETMKREVERQAALGFSERQITEAIGISISTWQRNKEHFEYSLKKGRSALRERITSALLSKIDENDSTSLIFVCKRLGLFTNSFDATTPNNPKEAMAEMLRIYISLADGTITDSQADKLMGTLQSFIKAYEISELERRVKAIEEKRQ